MPFGTQRSHSGANTSDYKYTDQELDNESNLYNYDARLYDPVIGRFISADTIAQASYSPQTLNWYSYGLNNPLIYTDPSGHTVKVIGRSLNYYRVWNPWLHSAIVIKPNKPEDFKGVSFGGIYYKGLKEWTIGGYQGENDRLITRIGTSSTGNKYADYDKNKKSDELKVNIEIKPPKGVSDTEFINKIMEVISRYKSGSREYEGYPDDKNEGNCHNVTTGILEGSGVDPAVIKEIAEIFKNAGLSPGIGEALPEMVQPKEETNPEETEKDKEEKNKMVNKDMPSKW